MEVGFDQLAELADVQQFWRDRGRKLARQAM